MFPSLLVDNITRNNLSGVVSAYNVGVAGANGVRTIKVCPPTTVNDEVWQSTGGATLYWGGEWTPREINCITLEKLMADNNLEGIDFLKMDCEGAEFETLYTSRHLLKYIKHISMEVHPSRYSTVPDRDSNELYRYLEDNGFSIEFSSVKYLAELNKVDKRRIHHSEACRKD